MAMKKASAPERQTGTTVGVPITETLMLIGTQTTATVAITSTGAITTTTSVRASDAVMKMVTTADINMVASLMESIPSWIPSCHKSSISRLFADDREDDVLVLLVLCARASAVRPVLYHFTSSPGILGRCGIITKNPMVQG